MSSAPSPCPGCQKDTQTIFGRCPNCGYQKGPAPTRTLHPPPLFGDTFGDLDYLIWFAPGAVLLILGLLIIGSEILIVLGIAATLAAAINVLTNL